MNLYCPCYFDMNDLPAAGPHDFEFGENKLIFCTSCGETRTLDPNVNLAAPPVAPTPKTSIPNTSSGPSRGNGILP